MRKVVLWKQKVEGTPFDGSSNWLMTGIVMTKQFMKEYNVTFLRGVGCRGAYCIPEDLALAFRNRMNKVEPKEPYIEVMYEKWFKW